MWIWEKAEAAITNRKGDSLDLNRLTASKLHMLLKRRRLQLLIAKKQLRYG
jgi:hypothetical protein